VTQRNGGSSGSKLVAWRGDSGPPGRPGPSLRTTSAHAWAEPADGNLRQGVHGGCSRRCDKERLSVSERLRNVASAASILRRACGHDERGGHGGTWRFRHRSLAGAYSAVPQAAVGHQPRHYSGRGGDFPP
jgi:hypothetical protein